MAIHTSAITYRRGIPNSYNNFYFIAQANNVVPSPLNLYLRNYQFYNRNIINQTRSRWPWKP
jgi:hypothetical protein